MTAGYTDAAISLLESLISKLQTMHNPLDPPLASALTDLAKLYSSKGFSLKADQLHSRASTIQHRLLCSSFPSRYSFLSRLSCLVAEKISLLGSEISDFALNFSVSSGEGEAAAAGLVAQHCSASH